MLSRENSCHNTSLVRFICFDLLTHSAGRDVSLCVKSHIGSIPSQPHLGSALAKFELEFPAPALSLPGENPGSFINDAIFHVISSTASFTLLSPFRHSTILIRDLNASAFYNHTLPIGQIITDTPFQIPPGTSKSPRLPVDWRLDSVGYRAVTDAIGGRLKLDAKAQVGIQIGRWKEQVWYEGQGLGASIRL